jgi:V/A-type H+-transporting ATPase subunit A
MVPFGIEGTVVDITEGEFTIEDTVARIEGKDGIGMTKTHGITMMQKWPVRRGRPYKEKLALDEPLITGQRIIDHTLSHSH